MRNELWKPTCGLGLSALLGMYSTIALAEPPMPKPVVVAVSAPAMVGSFTGEYVDGAPVYRLPSVTVTANKKEELAKIAEEDRLAAFKQKGNARAAGTQFARTDVKRSGR